jgi:hypothetical protein
MSLIMPIVSVTDGPRVTVNDLINNPTVVPLRILDLAKNQFVAESIFRNAGANDSGVVEFFQSTPLFANTATAIRNEFGEYQVTTTSLGIPSVATTVDRGLGLIISDEMRMRNKMDRVNTQITQVKNTLVRDWDTAFFGLFLANTSVPTHAVTTGWATSTTIRQDINYGVNAVNNAVTGQQSLNFLNFQADTMVITETQRFNLLNSTQFATIYQGNLADENLLYTGKIPQKILNLDVLVVKSGGPLPDNNVIIMERNTVGFISDEEPLQSTPLYRQQERRQWRCDTNRRSAMGVDQPLAAIVLTNT